MAPLLQGGLDFCIISIIIKTERCLKELKKSIKDKSE